jgi:hypothetical protein
MRKRRMCNQKKTKERLHMDKQNLRQSSTRVEKGEQGEKERRKEETVSRGKEETVRRRR